MGQVLWYESLIDVRINASDVGLDDSEQAAWVQTICRESLKSEQVS
jgi:hypothetical protein